MDLTVALAADDADALRMARDALENLVLPCEPSVELSEPEAMRRSREEIRRRARETIAAARAETK